MYDYWTCLLKIKNRFDAQLYGDFRWGRIDALSKLFLFLCIETSEEFSHASCEIKGGSENSMIEDIATDFFRK